MDGSRGLEAEFDVDEHTREVPERMVGIIIGKGGSNIKRLQQESGATIELRRDGSRMLSVRGRKAQVEAAIRLLDDLGVEQEVPVAPKQIPLIIGRGGATIRQLSADSGATIDVSKEDGVVRMRGSQAQVDDAVRRVNELLAEQSGGGGGAGAGAAAAGGPPPGLKGAAVNGPPPGLTQ